MSDVPTFWIETKDDENTVLSVGEKEVATLNHDEHGFAGMKSATEMFRRIAFAVGTQVKEL